MKCPECGYENYEGEAYCSECGAVLGDETIIAYSEDLPQEQHVFLVVGDDEIEIHEGQNILGREDADILISDPEEYVSRQHCILILEDGLLKILDRSLNGTFVNGERALKDTEIEVNDGDELKFAKVSAKVKIN